MNTEKYVDIPKVFSYYKVCITFFLRVFQIQKIFQKVFELKYTLYIEILPKTDFVHHFLFLMTIPSEMKRRRYSRRVVIVPQLNQPHTHKYPKITISFC